MKTEKTPTVAISNAKLDTSRTELLQSKKELKELILFQTDEKLTEKYSDFALDRENEKFKLLSGVEISLKEVKDYIHGKARNLAPMFHVNTYYKSICRLRGWAEAEAENYIKRREFADFTNEVIYGRFDRGVMLSLHTLNPYTGYITRTYKHYQFMTDEGIIKLAGIIEEAIKMMNECRSYYEFRKKWSEEYGVPYNKSLFEGTTFA